ncbi:TPA: MBL fold metallo-hydrolase [Pseudomonas aeruginosa]
MKLRNLATTMILAIGMTGHGAFAQSAATHADISPAKAVQIQQIRNATTKITYGQTTFLIDPMLAKKGTYPGFEGTYRSELRNPLVDLPMPVADVMAGVDAVIVTHTHLDHWDDAAQQLLPKDLPLFVQNESDAGIIRGQGFHDVRVLAESTKFGGVKLSKTGGQHGTDAMFAVPALAEFLGQAMGVVFEAPGYKSLYLAGDTIWRSEVDQVLAQYKPGLIVLNAGYARVNGYDGAIIMGKDDVLRASQAAPEATIVAVHMDAINHMGQSRDELTSYVQQKGIEKRVEIPADGELLKL